MSSFMREILENTHHFNMLLLLGISLFGGTVGGKLFKKLRIPQVVGYIIIGIILGQTGFKVISKESLQALQPFNYFALGLIGFLIGGELKKSIFVKYGRQFLSILLFEGLTAFVVVTLLSGVVCVLFYPNAKTAWALALLLGAIASATAPAATTDVLWEYKTRGPLTTTILGIVALDDGLALMLFAIATSFAGSLLGNASEGIMTFLQPVYEIFGSAIIGMIGGAILSALLKGHSEEDHILAFSIGLVVMILGISLVLKLDMLLAAMALGATVTNLAPRRSKEVFKLVERFTPPINVLFFVLVGAKLNVGSMSLAMFLLAGVYFVGRTVGKMSGAFIGAKLSGAPDTVRRYLPLCLFSQAGVAIGLSILAGQKFEGEIGNSIVMVIAGTTFLVQLIGPSCVKIAVQKAKECGLNISEEDLMKNISVAEIMDSDIPKIPENTSLQKVLQIFSEHENLYFPVVDGEGKLSGIITVENIKNSMLHSSLNPFLVAIDIMEMIPVTVTPQTPMVKVKQLIKDHKLEYIPVVTDGKLDGFLESRAIEQLVSHKFLEMQRQVA